ncbi:MAG: 50S ribosomal protein L3 [Proteobacteria bacterium]|nr:50S ribosomal protein L3 [Pseudomonadota bacterium]
MLELLGKKIGMTHLFADDGAIVPLTMVHIYENCVLSFLSNEKKDFDYLSLAFEKATHPQRVPKPVAGIFNKKSLPLFKKIHNSQIKKGSSLKTGDSISLESVINTGDKISVRGTTIGKGFAGVMKRWNFRGLEASHGVSVSHRSHGSTGQRQDPGKTFKGKKMAGHMGVANVTTKSLEVILVDKEKSIIGIKGSVPGHAGSDVIIKIAKVY